MGTGGVVNRYLRILLFNQCCWLTIRKNLLNKYKNGLLMDWKLKLEKLEKLEKKIQNIYSDVNIYYFWVITY